MKKNSKPHSYIFKWYFCAYMVIAIVVTYLEYDNWFGMWLINFLRLHLMFCTLKLYISLQSNILFKGLYLILYVSFIKLGILVHVYTSFTLFS